MSAPLNRSRSVSRSRVVKIDHESGGKEFLDPIALLEDLLPHIKNFNVPLTVTLRDSMTSVAYLLPVFVSKHYDILGTQVKFGFKRLELKDLKVSISFDLELTMDGTG